MKQVLLVEPDPAGGEALLEVLAEAGATPVRANRASDAIALLWESPFDLVLTELRMPGQDGLWLLRCIRSEWVDLPVIFLTADGTIPIAVAAVKAGATDFIPKPFQRADLLLALRRALASKPAPPSARAEMVSAPILESPAMQEALESITRAAPTLATVLLRGETGTGKSRLAQQLHRLSGRSGPFVTVFCGALPESLIESELFGYEKGAFTGATGRKLGRLELAQGGTLFFDEIGELSAAIQVKLLRLFQDREFERIGGTETLHADVRFVVATHRDLEAAVAQGDFREDLYYRLNVVPIDVPALRDRPVDIQQLTLRFLEDFSRIHRRPDFRLSKAAMAAILGCPWPGNVRQLQNLLERLVVLHGSNEVSADDVRRQLARVPAFSEDGSPQPARKTETRAPNPEGQGEREAIEAALRQADNNRTLAAKLLGVSRRTLYNKLQQHRLLS